MAREYFKMFHSYLKSIEPLDDVERGRLFTAMLEYSMTGEAPKLTGNERFIFPTMQANIDRGVEGYETMVEMNRAHGRSGGRPRKTEWVSEDEEKTRLVSDDTEKTRLVSEKPDWFLKSQDKDKEEDNEKDKEKDNDNDKEEVDARAARTPTRPEREAEPVDARDEWNRQKTSGKQGGSRFIPPTAAEVAEYVKQRGSCVDPQGFVDFYAAKGWKVGQSPMQDWRAACRNAEHWERWNRDGPSRGVRAQEPPAEEPDGQESKEVEQLMRLYQRMQAQGMALPPTRGHPHREEGDTCH